MRMIHLQSDRKQIGAKKGDTLKYLTKFCDEISIRPCVCVCVLCVPISRTFILTDRIFLKRILIWVCVVTEIKVRVKYTHTLKTTAKWQNHMSLALVYRKQYNQYTFWLEGERKKQQPFRITTNRMKWLFKNAWSMCVCACLFLSLCDCDKMSTIDSKINE